MVWDTERIVQRLRQLQRAGQPMSYTQLARSHQRLVSAAAYHFGSYRKALEAAGIDHRDVTQRPRWTRHRIIALIKQAHRRGKDLNWAAVTRADHDVSKAAFAALQPRLFGSWPRALRAAGLDADDVACYRTWDRNTVIVELRSRAQQSKPLSSGAVQKTDPALHAAAVRYFGSYRTALRAAKLKGKRTNDDG
jgi:hypothetical protein